MEENPTRACELTVGPGEVEVRGVDDVSGTPLVVHVRTRARPATPSCENPTSDQCRPGYRGGTAEAVATWSGLSRRCRGRRSGRARCDEISASGAECTPNGVHYVSGHGGSHGQDRNDTGPR